MNTVMYERSLLPLCASRILSDCCTSWEFQTIISRGYNLVMNIELIGVLTMQCIQHQRVQYSYNPVMPPSPDYQDRDNLK